MDTCISCIGSWLHCDCCYVTVAEYFCPRNASGKSLVHNKTALQWQNKSLAVWLKHVAEVCEKYACQIVDQLGDSIKGSDGL